MLPVTTMYVPLCRYILSNGYLEDCEPWKCTFVATKRSGQHLLVTARMCDIYQMLTKGNGVPNSNAEHLRKKLININLRH